MPMPVLFIRISLIRKTGCKTIAELLLYFLNCQNEVIDTFNGIGLSLPKVSCLLNILRDLTIDIMTIRHLGHCLKTLFSDELSLADLSLNKNEKSRIVKK